jgi:hypothetical protein
MLYKTDLNLVLDASASMSQVFQETLNGFNGYLKEQKQHPESARISLYQFNTSYRTIYANSNLIEAPELSSLNYKPSGFTALLDAIGNTINNTGQRLEHMWEGDRPQQVMIVIITDGLENASRAFNKSQIMNMISHQEQKYNWQFVYIGANLDAIVEGDKYGSILSSNSLSFNALSESNTLSTPGQYLTSSFNKLSSASKKLRSCNAANVTNFFEEENKIDYAATKVQ